MRLALLSLSLFLSICIPTASANEPASRKPNPPYKSSVLSRNDAERLALGLEAASDGDWSIVERQRDQINDPTARKLLFWRLADSSLSGAEFDTLNQALTELRGWPNLRQLQIQAEEKISTSSLSSAQRIAWLEESGPISGEGKIELAEAYQRQGRNAEAERLIKDAWHQHSFLVSRQREIANAHAEILAPEDHVKRTDYLLWTSQRSAASAMKSYLPSDWDRLVDARIGLATGAGGVDGLINRVPAHLQTNPGLLYERSKWRRRRGRWEDAREPLLEIDPTDLPERALAHIWDEKNLHLRRMIRDEDWQTAYNLSSTHGLTSGVDFAEGEFNAGWIALRFLNRPQDALRHFQTLEAGVGTSLSKSRAQYWTGEAFSALSQPAQAQEAYRRGAENITYFYGQRSAERLGQTTMTLPPLVVPTNEERQRFESMELVRALRMLAENGEDYQFRRVSYHLDDLLESEVEYQLIFELAESYGLTQAGVRGAKAGLSKGIVATSAAYPDFAFTIPRDRPSSADDALIMALSRQETEMNPRAISPARAYGLMQLLSSTARQQARREGVSYRFSWLLDDPVYNITLGRGYLGDMIDRFDGSYIMAIAAYNAGPGRPARWVGEYGDPRKDEIDPIDFIESIPFSETRSYVQRVLENVQVYRARLAGGTAPLRLSQDLTRGH